MEPGQPLHIAYEDTHLLLLNKPAGLLVQPTGEPCTDRHDAQTMLSQQVGYRVWPAHRIDRGTSGLVVMVKEQGWLPVVQSLFQDRLIEKHYLAWIIGVMKPESGVLETALAVPHGNGKVQTACTHYQTLDTLTLDFPNQRPSQCTFSLVEVGLQTGRKHQIRRHFGAAGHPLLGDHNYGSNNINRLLARYFKSHHLWLHAHRLAFHQPFTGLRVEIECPPPTEWNALHRHIS